MEEVLSSSPLVEGGKERNHGVDLLRIAAMFMVVVYCVLTYGGIVGAQAENSFGYVLLNCLSAFVFCAVNVFAAISGYANAKNSFKLRRVIKLWVRVFAYIILINLGYMVYLLIAGKSFTFKSFIKASLPILNDRYWYFTAYFVLCFFILCGHASGSGPEIPYASDDQSLRQKEFFLGQQPDTGQARG